MPLQEVSYVGDDFHADAHTISYDAQVGTTLARTSRPKIYAGTGAPTFSANTGSLYIRLDGSSTSTRLYVNTGTTTWTNVTTAA